VTAKATGDPFPVASTGDTVEPDEQQNTLQEKGNNGGFS
jgi:hypothetical protein